MKELFIVEGESAASIVRQAMYKPTQSVLASQGKLINVKKVSSNKVLANQTCQKIFQALNCDFEKNCNPDNLAYSHILILTDPDPDGVHSRLLMLNFFYHYLKPLIDTGVVSIIIPPLFRMTELFTSNRQYAWDEEQRIQLLNKMNSSNKDIETSWIKGIAQFSVSECSRLLLHPNTRKQINIISTEAHHA
jgi:DNA gyrase/topoisomerase IV subunit B